MKVPPRFARNAKQKTVRAPRSAVPEEMITESNENAAGATIETFKEAITVGETDDDTESSVVTKTDPDR